MQSGGIFQYKILVSREILVLCSHKGYFSSKYSVSRDIPAKNILSVGIFQYKIWSVGIFQYKIQSVGMTLFQCEIFGQ